MLKSRITKYYQKKMKEKIQAEENNKMKMIILIGKYKHLKNKMKNRKILLNKLQVYFNKLKK